MKLVIAEKPSVAKTLAAALNATEQKDGYIEGGGYLVSWCFGHLIELATPSSYGEKYQKWNSADLPIIPETWKFEAYKDKKKQLDLICNLMNDDRVDSIVCATDAGREGELIFRLVYNFAGCTKPIERLWISSMEDTAIREGFESLKDGHEYDSLYDSALCRSKADWIVGINATRLFTCIYNKTLHVGRVQTPTLKMLVDRSSAIANFRKEKYYHVRLNLSGAEATSERISDIDKANALKEACEKAEAKCTSVTKEKKTVSPPKLFDLTSLQREANKLYGYTAKQTLDIAQSLYEKRLLTYPRTDSCYLTDDMDETAKSIAKLSMQNLPCMQGLDFAPETSRLLNSKKVSDHHAIIPTKELSSAKLSTLSEAEQNILILTGSRLLFATSVPHVFEAVTAAFSCADSEFAAKGKTVITPGWKELERRYRATLKSKPEGEDEAENILPEFSEGQTFSNPEAKVTEHFTTPPKPHTEASLLAAMERAGNEDTDPEAERRGLGTPATRAAIIEKLVSSGLVERKGKQLNPTKDGHNLICVLPDTLTSPKLTSDWENNLTQIAKGSADPDEFMNGIETMTKDLVKAYPFVSDEEKNRFESERPTVGKCPRCGSSVYEGKKGFFCENKDCSFALWKDNKFFTNKKKSITKSIATALLKNGRVNMNNLYSEKTGKTYNAIVILDDTGDKYVNFKLEFPKTTKK